MSDDFDYSEWGEPGLMGKQIADATAAGAVVSIGSDGERWIVNYVADPDVEEQP